jgi:lipid-A-disaccharide synthase
MEAAGMSCDFVGHPVVTEPQATEAEIAEFRAKYDVADGPVILVLPGSRRSEVERLMPIFGAALHQVVARHPKARLVLPAAPAVAALVAARVSDWPAATTVLDPRGRLAEEFAADKRAAFATADLALAASGTVSLELAATDTPMVIAYTMSWLSRKLIGALLRVDTVTLVNLVSDTRTIPEFLSENCRPDPIAAALLGVIEDGRQRADQLDAMALAMRRLGRGGDAPWLRAARSVLAHIPDR